MYTQTVMQQYIEAVDAATARFNTVKNRLHAEHQHLEQIHSQLDLLQAAIQKSAAAKPRSERSLRQSRSQA